MATIPSGGYPKMPTATDVAGRSVPLVFPAGDANQFQFAIINNSTEEAAFNAGTGKFANAPVAITTVSGGVVSSHGNGGWISGNWKKT
jgi:hypothetical protein